MFSKPKAEWLAQLGLFYAALVWGSTFFLVKSTLASVDPVFLVAYRFTISAMIIGGFLITLRRPLFSRFSQGLVLGLFLWSLYVPQTLGLKYTSASNSGFITGLFVAFVPLFGWLFFRKAVRFNNIVAVCVSVFGLWLLTGGLQSINIGDVLTILTAMAYAIHVLYADKYVRAQADPFVLSFQQFLVVGLLSFLTGFGLKLPYQVTSVSVFWVIGFLVLIPTLSAFVIQLFAQKRVSATKVSLIFVLEPVFAAAFAWTLGGEAFILSRAFGGILIVVAMIISELPIKHFLKIKLRYQ